MSDFDWCRGFLVEGGASIICGVIGDVSMVIELAGTRFVFNAEGDYLRTESL